jgi:calcium-dependent protein kinase
MLYIMLCGYPPFFGESKAEIKKMVLESKLEFDVESWKDLSPESMDLIRSMLAKESERLTA